MHRTSVGIRPHLRGFCHNSELDIWWFFTPNPALTINVRCWAEVRRPADSRAKSAKTRIETSMQDLRRMFANCSRAISTKTGIKTRHISLLFSLKMGEKRGYETKRASLSPTFFNFLTLFSKCLGLLRVDPSECFHFLKVVCFYSSHVIRFITGTGNVTPFLVHII